MAILLLYIPVLWLAYSANKQMRLSRRLIEEYSHKETLSKTYEGLATQVNNLEDNELSQQLRNQLLYNLLQVSSENPGKLISDYKSLDHPVTDVLNQSARLTLAEQRLRRFPGLKGLTEKLTGKSKEALNRQAQRLEGVIDKGSDKILDKVESGLEVI